ncbi:PAS domain S-box protein [Solirubrobacter phytolaccae]|uniref:Sensor-like histidine kinase SenX3 n=1 Tax=Solirubrobacter phytolaccae TaxID=1404360 RepID=A0A9X3SD36_9ACTN|nr:PAS domain S-box protein [Solirubrobacter phytolaccae]MDA0179327.1 PAS domain S-box protein [Solirubrobacter phytolaccae]
MPRSRSPESALFAAAAESLPIAIVFGDREGRITYVNPFADALFGLDGADLRGTDVTAFTAPEDREEARAIVRCLLAGEAVSDALILQLRREDGSTFPAELTLSPMFDEAGAVIGVAGMARDVTLRHSADAAAARLRGIVDAALEAILGVDVDGTVLFFSPSAERLFGWSAAEIVGQSGDLLVTAEYRIGAPALFAVLEAKGSLRADTMALRSDGTAVEVELSAAPIRDADGTITGAAMTVLDVSERRREQRLLERIIENAPNAIGVKDLDGRYLFFSFGAGEVPSPDAVGRTDAELFPPEVAVRSVEQDRIVLETGAPATFRETILFRDGTDHQFVTTKFPLVGPHGRLEGLGVIAHDVTELRQAELDQARLAALVQAAPDAIVARDEHGRVVTWNPGAEAMFGLRAEAVLGRSYADLVVPDDERARHEALVAEAQAGQTLTVQVIRRRGDGTLFPAQVSVAPLTLLDGTWRGTLAMIRDITNLVEAELQLRERAQQLERSNAELERFAYAASHDLQEPLHSIKLSAGAVSLAAEDLLGDEERALLTGIDESASRLSAQIRGLMQVARVALGEAPGEQVPVTVAVRDAIDALRAATLEAQAEVVVDEPLPPVEVPRSEVALVLQNVIANAIKYRREGVPPRVQVTVEAGEELVEIRVTDNGVGLSETDLARVFGLFERGATNASGTGLGLAVARRMIERLGGSLDASSPGVGHGCVFTLVVPFVA